LMALYFSRDMLKVFKDTAFHDSLDSLFKKVKATLPPESTKYLDQVEETLQVGIKPYKHYGKFREIISRANEAAVSKRSVEIVYYTMSRKKETTRKVDPYRIWFFSGTFYLIGHCHLRHQVRIFALDRVKMLHLTKDEFKIPEGFNLDDFLKPSFGVFQGEQTKVTILFNKEVAGYIAEKVWHDSQKLFPQADGSLLFKAEVAGTEEIKFWVMNWGSKALVLEPESLRDEIRDEAATLVERYEKEGRGMAQKLAKERNT
jgi:predicted DNA-binding transcriptional regulator YafY